MKRVLLLLIRGYQLVLSPVLGSHCRFYPSCSCYSHEAVKQYGSIKGFYLAIRRISRCHPWSEGGYDPVPEMDGVQGELESQTEVTDNCVVDPKTNIRE